METAEQMTQIEKRGVKISIPDEINDRAGQAFRELKKRGAQVRMEDLFADLLLKADEKYFDAQVEKHTPDEYLINLAIQNPEAKRLLIEQARKALEAINKGDAPVKVRMRAPKGEA
jgi:hypothetical protein